MKSRIDWRVDIPCFGRADLSAMTLKEWEDLQWEQWRKEAGALPPGPQPWNDRAPQTARERYGWRGLLGTSYLGPQRGFGPAEG